ncbi:MAG: hypothetical protein GC154_05615 [bacterium]|nr:hypothetical protein [bacterium]
MAEFHYRASDEQGRITEGTLSAESRGAVIHSLGERGLSPIRIDGAAKSKRNASVEETLYRALPISRAKIAAVYEQLSLMMGSGVSLVDGLQALEEQADDFRIREVLAQVRSKVEEGVALHTAMRDRPDVFDDLSVHVAEAGEQSGQMDKALGRLAGMIEFDIQIKRRLNEATRYPKIVLCILAGAVCILLSLVVPKFAAMFENARVQLPLVTRVLIFGYRGVLDYWPIAAFVALLAIVGLTLARRRPRYDMMMESFKIRAPITGALQLKIEISRIFRMLGVLLDSGVDILNALELATRIARNKVLAAGLSDMRRSIENGQSLTDSLERLPFLPKMAKRMIVLGDKSGRLSQSLIQLSDIFERQTQSTIKSIGGMLEPMLIVAIGVVVLLFALGIFMPMWDMIKVVQ